MKPDSRGPNQTNRVEWREVSCARPVIGSSWGWPRTTGSLLARMGRLDRFGGAWLAGAELTDGEDRKAREGRQEDELLHRHLPYRKATAKVG
jgi:hypothetical protein